MTPRQLLRQVQLPLALPSIVAGIRVAAVIGVGTATIAAAVGAGGLGEYIFRGLSMVDPTVILAGAIPAAVLALSLDGGLMLAERAVRARLGRRRRSPAHGCSRLAAVAMLAARRLVPSRASRGARRRDPRRVEELHRADHPRRDAGADDRGATGLRVERRLNLGGTFICDRAIRSGDIDVYVEYTGTAHTAVFRQPPRPTRGASSRASGSRYADGGLTLLDPLGFENTFAILVRGDDAERLRLKTIEDAAPHAPAWQAGFGYEFLQREDGYPGLARAYGLTFAAPPRAMDLSLIYRALADRQVDLIAGDATSGLIEAYGLAMLEDNRRYFPPYDAVPVARSATLLAHPAVRDALTALRVQYLLRTCGA